MELTADELWTRILDAARSGIPEQGFRTWVEGATALGLSDDDELMLEAASEFHVQWLEDKYGSLLCEVGRKIVGRPIRISARARAGGPKGVPTVELSPAAPESNPPPVPSPTRPAKRPLNERYTFDRFVVGARNQLAVAGAKAVADRPAKVYNPLFLYGGVGLGKTHLMHAIGNHILDHGSAEAVAYVPSEQFTNELVTAIQNGTTAAFRRRYRRMDLLLVDDVHFLESKERTQEEFFHTFNALHDAHRQIVLTSDRPPKEIPGLEERLVSRFEWGLVADIKAPDYETRIAILRKKASDDDLVLDEEVIDFIARSCTSSVRELEGAVIKLLAYSSLRHEEITLELAQKSLQAVLRKSADGPPLLSAERIRQVTAEEWNVSSEGLASKRRTRDLTVPRHVAMYVIKELLDLPLTRIGECFGGRDHSTVHHSINTVQKLLASDPEFRHRVERVRRQVRGEH